MLNVNLEPDRATVSVVGEITEELAIELVDRVERLHAERFYTRIELEIASPGGAIVALDHCIDGLCRLREAGVEISTRALTRAVSAAAILVSLGDRRAAMPRSLLQYHMGRVGGVHTVTADSASQIVEALHEIDRRLVALLWNGRDGIRCRPVGGTLCFPPMNSGNAIGVSSPVLQARSAGRTVRARARLRSKNCAGRSRRPCGTRATPS